MNQSSYIHTIIDLVSLRIDDLIELIALTSVNEVFQGSRSLVGRYDVDGLLFGATHPVRELERVRNGRRQQDQVHVSGKHDDDFFPHDSSLEIVDVVDLVEYDPFDVANKIRSFVQHRSQDFRSDDKTCRLNIVPKEYIVVNKMESTICINNESPRV